MLITIIDDLKGFYTFYVYYFFSFGYNLIIDEWTICEHEQDLFDTRPKEPFTHMAYENNIISGSPSFDKLFL